MTDETVGIAIFVVIILSCIIALLISIKRFLFGKANHIKTKIRNKESRVEYYRNLPCGGNIYVMFYALTHSAKDPITINFINAVIVKWYREKKVDILYDKTNDVVEVVFKNGVNYDHKAEQMFYHTMMSFAGNDERLTYDDLVKSLKYHLSTYQYFMDNISTYISGEVLKYTMYKEREKFEGLIRFINDFSVIPELNKDEVHLRDAYVTFAILGGCADKIKDEFDNIMPFNISKLYSYIDQMNNLVDAFDSTI